MNTKKKKITKNNQYKIIRYNLLYCYYLYYIYFVIYLEINVMY